MYVEFFDENKESARDGSYNSIIILLIIIIGVIVNTNYFYWVDMEWF